MDLFLRILNPVSERTDGVVFFVMARVGDHVAIHESISVSVAWRIKERYWEKVNQ